MSPQISVVVCIYNVERYLRDCLESIAGQSFTDFECILCDDDSSDASGLIASSFAESDARFRYIHQANRGPGPAGGRNGAIPHITGDYILFVDSDDILLPDALAVLHSSAQASGSDLVIGGVDRFNSSGRWPSFLHQRVHERFREATCVEDFPEMVWDSTAWNKLISTQLWIDHIKLFDEGRLYEDLYPMIRLMCLANSVDVLTDTVYLWRDRESKTSVTQQVASPRGLIDKVDQMLKLDEFLTTTGNTITKRAQDHKLLTADVIWMLDDLDRGGQEYHDAFWVEAPKLIDAMDPAIRAQLPPNLRAQYKAIATGDQATLNGLRREGGARFRPDEVRQAFSADDRAELNGTENLLTELFGRATSVSVDGADIVVKGFAALDQIRLGRTEGTFAIWFEIWEAGKRIEVDTPLTIRPRLHLTRQGPQLHRYTGFEVRVPAEDLVGTDVPVGSVLVGARLVADGGQNGSGRLRFGETHTWKYPQSAEGASVRAYRDHHGMLSIRASAPQNAEIVGIDGDILSVRLKQSLADSNHQVRLFEPEFERQWLASTAPTSDDLGRIDLSGLAFGEYELQVLRTSREYEDGWVPIATPDAGTHTLTVGDRVLRLHLGTANTFIEVARDPSEFRDLKPTIHSAVDQRLTELARTINKFTWI